MTETSLIARINALQINGQEINRRTSVADIKENEKTTIMHIITDFIGEEKITTIKNAIENGVITEQSNTKYKVEPPKYNIDRIESINKDAYDFIKVFLPEFDFKFYFFLKLALIIIETYKKTDTQIKDEDIEKALKYSKGITSTFNDKLGDIHEGHKKLYNEAVGSMTSAIEKIFPERVKYYNSIKDKAVADLRDAIDEHIRNNKNKEDPITKIVKHIIIALDLAQTDKVAEADIREYIKELLNNISTTTKVVSSSGGSGFIFGKELNKHIKNINEYPRTKIQKDLIKILQKISKGSPLEIIKKHLQKLTHTHKGGGEGRNDILRKMIRSFRIYLGVSPNDENETVSSFDETVEEQVEPETSYEDAVNTLITKIEKDGILNNVDIQEFNSLVDKWVLYDNTYNNDGINLTKYKNAENIIISHKKGKYNEIVLLNFFNNMRIMCSHNDKYYDVDVVYYIGELDVKQTNKEGNIECIKAVLNPNSVLDNFKDRSQEFDDYITTIDKVITKIEKHNAELITLGKEMQELEKTNKENERALNDIGEKLERAKSETDAEKLNKKLLEQEKDTLNTELENNKNKFIEFELAYRFKKGINQKNKNKMQEVINTLTEFDNILNEPNLAIAEVAKRQLNSTLTGFQQRAKDLQKMLSPVEKPTAQQQAGGAPPAEQTTIVEDIDNTRKLSANIQNVENILKEIKNEWEGYKATVPPKEFKDASFNTYLDKVKEHINIQGDKNIFGTPSYADGKTTYAVKNPNVGEETPKANVDVDDILVNITNGIYNKSENNVNKYSISDIKGLATRYVEDAKLFKNSLKNLVNYISSTSISIELLKDTDTDKVSIDKFLIEDKAKIYKSGKRKDITTTEEQKAENDEVEKNRDAIIKFLKTIESNFVSLSKDAYTDADISKINGYFQSENGGKLISRLNDKFDKATKETEYILKSILEYGKKYSSVNNHIKTDIFEKLQPKLMKSGAPHINLVALLNDIKRTMIYDINTTISNIQSTQKKSGGNTKMIGVETKPKTLKDTLNDNRKIADDLINGSNEEFKKLRALHEDLFNTFTKMGNPENLGSSLASNNYESIFNTIFNKYIEDKKNETGEYVASKHLIRSLKSNNLIPEEVLAIDLRDKIVFIFATLFIRILTLIIIEYIIDKGTIKSLDVVVIAFLITFTILLLLMVLIVNLDEYKLRTIFNYINLHTGGAYIMIYLAVVWAFGCLIYFIMYKINKEVVFTAENDEDRGRLKYKIEVVSMIIWVWGTMVVLAL